MIKRRKGGSMCWRDRRGEKEKITKKKIKERKAARFGDADV